MSTFTSTTTASTTTTMTMSNNKMNNHIYHLNSTTPSTATTTATTTTTNKNNNSVQSTKFTLPQTSTTTVRAPLPINATSSVADVVAWFELVLDDGDARRRIVEVVRELNVNGALFSERVHSLHDVMLQFSLHQLTFYEQWQLHRAGLR